ncbi:anthranilate synthase component I [Lignipirellula cremea]|uniref:Anthranilate synthase component 1 n=1 Tax=Lignipirellula cremea TaxID=2528010 RepID=A0A518E190_9BACT|nr:anthranilate synthase component I [Lignipirellula cremea]QDU97834.1 Anthranilate synthase component 1 [Lignipirellula cremea]
MTHYPSFAAFEKLAAAYDMVPVCRRLISDTLTPVTAFHRIDQGGPACLFESVVGGEKVGRYSFLAAEPFLTLSARGPHVEIATADGQVEEIECDNPLNELRLRLSEVKVAHLESLPPFTGGAVGYAAYDVIRYVEDLPDAPADDRNLPDLSFAFYDQMIVFDNVNKTATVIAMARTDDSDGEAETAYQSACQRVDDLVALLSTPNDKLQPADIETGGELKLPSRSNFTQPEFEAAVRRCVEYIEAGDIFQVVISQRFEVDITADPFEIYRTLRVVNPSPFMFFLRTPETVLVGSSPEIMCRVVDNRVTVRPLAGTRPRGANEQEDRRLAEELLNDPKERAEHVMLVDLGRNDVGRVSKFGAVELTDVMTVERYSHVMHISSNVNGELRDDCDAFDALLASLPAGTVSGAPKVRAMQIIDELEPHRRGPYAGAVGYFDYSGNMDTCIALRTLVIQNGKAYVQAGAGIVADSDPTLEYQETLNKARGLLKAIEITERRTQK